MRLDALEEMDDRRCAEPNLKRCLPPLSFCTTNGPFLNSSSPASMSGAGKQAAQQAAKLGGRDKPSVYGIIAITAATAISMGVWWKRKASQDVELLSPDTREAGMPQHAPGGVEQGYGRKSAEATGMLEGDRAYQGVFPTGKIVNALEGVLPASKEGHPTKDPEYKGGKY